MWNRENREKHRCYVRNYYIGHKEAEIRKVSRWAKDNPEKNRKKAHKYYINNKDKVQTKRRETYKNNDVHERAYAVYYYHKDIDKSRQENRLRYLLNKEKYKEKVKLWRQKHPEQQKIYSQNRRAKKMGAGTHTQKQVQSILELQNNKCLYCDISLDIISKHLDHFIPLSRGGTNTEENLVWACYKCNLNKKDKFATEWEGWNGAYPVKWNIQLAP